MANNYFDFCCTAQYCVDCLICSFSSLCCLLQLYVSKHLHNNWRIFINFKTSNLSILLPQETVSRWIAADEWLTDLISLLLSLCYYSEGSKRCETLYLHRSSPFCKNLELDLFHFKCQPMENMTHCGFVYPFTDHTHTIWDKVKLWCKTQSSAVAAFLLLGMENMTDRGAVFTGPDETPKPLPVFSALQTRSHI